jgi:hypothetical protein
MNRLMRKIRRWSKRSEILAVADQDLERWLGSIGLLQTLDRGELTCHVCGAPIRRDDLQLVASLEGHTVVVCDRSHCVRSFCTGGTDE